MSGSGVFEFLINVLIDVSIAVVAAAIGGNGIVRKFWKRGLFRKGSYKFAGVVVKYGTTVTISYKSLPLIMPVIKEFGKAFVIYVGTVVVQAFKNIVAKAL